MIRETNSNPSKEVTQGTPDSDRVVVGVGAEPGDCFPRVEVSPNLTV